jgi:magnesium transporter
MEHFGKTYHPPGTPPGTLVEHEAVEPGGLTIHLVDYTASEFTERELVTPEECRPFLDKDSVTWIHLQGVTGKETMENIGELFGLHPLAMEDVLNKGQRPKIEEYEGQLFIVMMMLRKLNDATAAEQVSIFLGKNYIVSFHAGSNDPLEPLRHRLRKQVGHLRNSAADYLLYCILDLVIDQGYPVLEDYGEAVSEIEESLLTHVATQDTLAQIHRIRRELLLLRRSLWPQREIMNSLLRGGNVLINEGTLLYLRDCYDHVVQIMDLVETYRDMATNMVDVYLSSVSHRLNEIMRVLTLIATIFIPLTFVVGLYGMNFSHPDSPWAMPELHWYYGYPMVLLVMVAIVVGMVFYFRRKNWL